jgi:hypothetical protein
MLQQRLSIANEIMGCLALIGIGIGIGIDSDPDTDPDNEPAWVLVVLWRRGTRRFLRISAEVETCITEP